MFGVPEEDSGTTDDKILDLCNNHLKLQPPLNISEIEVSHRAGKTADQINKMQERKRNEAVRQGKPPESVPALRTPTGPRPVLVKFVSRRSKARVMAIKSALKDMHRRQPATVLSEIDHSDEAFPALGQHPPPAGAPPGEQPHDQQSNQSQPIPRYRFTLPVFFSDDLTQRRAKLAFRAREAKKNNKIADTWVFDCRVFVKDKYNNIHPINKEEDLHRFENNPVRE